MKAVQIRADHGMVSEEKIHAFEREHSIEFPKSYREFVAKHDAPWLNDPYFKFNNTYAESRQWPYRIVDGIDSRDITFLGFNESVSYGERINDCQDFDVFGHDQVVPFGISANGDFICFDYRCNPAPNAPQVVVMFHDVFDDHKKMAICQVAESFEQFMEILYRA